MNSEVESDSYASLRQQEDT